VLKRLIISSKESLLAVLPISIIILVLSFTPLAHLQTSERIVLIISAIILIIGIALFTLGAEMAIKPIGGKIGSSILRTNKLVLIIIVSFIMGFLVTLGESDLSVLLKQIHEIVNNTLAIVLIAIGLGLFLVFSVLKIIFKLDLSIVLMFSYLLLFGLTIVLYQNGNGVFLPFAFDTGYVTSGSLTVPFIMAFGLGIAATVGGSSHKESSFGVIALCTLGPIIMVLISELNVSEEVLYDSTRINESVIQSYALGDDVAHYFLHELLDSVKEVAIVLVLITIVFLIINKLFIKLPKDNLISIFVGLLFTFIGHVLFLTGAKVGYLPLGFRIGEMLAEYNPAIMIIIGFFLGLITVLAEPNVHILANQVEEITLGRVSKRSLLIALCIGVGISTSLALIRIIYQFSILYYIIPLIVISFALSFFVPKIYTAIAFDSGAVASGPLTVSFILPMAIGACTYLREPVLDYGFGLIAMVSLVPVITIQTLGFRSIIARNISNKRKLKQIISSDDEQIIDFM